MPETFPPWAAFSPCRRYRYQLGRRWARGPLLGWLLLNPSKADDREDDQTVKQCMSFARLWGYSGIVVANLFAYVETHPDKLPTMAAQWVGPENDAWIARTLTDCADVMCAWGGSVPLQGRDRQVSQLVADMGLAPWCLGLTREGYPRHPSRLAHATPRVPYLPRWS